MRILVTGAQGQLGRAIAHQGSEHELFLLGREQLDITQESAVQALFCNVKPEAVVHCAAYTNVDGAESDPEGAFKVNAIGSQNVAAACLELGARLVHISTDYVFDGEAIKSYREFDRVNPQSVYGTTKWQGEELVRQILGRHYILRTAWLYGDGNNFVRTMLRLADEQPFLKVVHDQIGSPTSTADLARAIFRLLQSDAYGTYHATCQGQCSWYEFAQEIFLQAGRKIEVRPVTTADFPRPARRPAHSVLDNYMLRMTVGDPMRPWQQALQDYLASEHVLANSDFYSK